MAGIKQIYRSPDAFRFPTYENVVSYPVNSVVSRYDSDSNTYRYWIAKTQTTAGSLDSDIFNSEWVQFAFDSDTLYKIMTVVFNDNFQQLTANIESDFAYTLNSLDSDNDSDFNVLYLKVDSDVRFIKRYVDSEIAKLYQRVDSDLDSDRLYLNTRVDNYLQELYYGRTYDSEVILSEIHDDRLSNTLMPSNDMFVITANYDDQVQEQTNIIWTAQNTSSRSFAESLVQHVNGNHKIEAGLDSETIFSSFSTPAYVSSISFRGSQDDGYFTSAYVMWTYEDGTTYEQDQPNAVIDNSERLFMYNPDINKRVTNIKLTGYLRSSEQTGINYIQIASARSLPVLRSERLSILHFGTISDMKKYAAHPDTAAFVGAVDTLFIAKDSEWTAVDPRYYAVDTSIENLVTNFPPAQLETNTRALIKMSGYEYLVRNGVWVLDTSTINGYDSDLVNSIDSDFKVLQQDFLDYQAVFFQNIEKFDDRLEENDSEITVLARALSTFYVDYVNLKKEHIRVHNDVDSQLIAWQNSFDSFVSNVNYQLHNNSAQDSDWQINFESYYLRLLQQHDSDNQLRNQNLREDFDSEVERLWVAILSNSVDISLLRNGKVADNDSDIRALERKTSGFDSDILYARTEAMKYRGIVDLTDSDEYPKMVEFGDVYSARTNGHAVSLWGAISGRFVESMSLVMYTRDLGWTVIDTSSSSNQEAGIGVPAGTILVFSTQDAIPDAFHVCDGSVYDPGLYSELYSILKTNVLPDLRGYFIRGWSEDNSVDPDGPRGPNTVQQDEIRSHSHQYIDRYSASSSEVGEFDAEAVADDDMRNQTRTTSPTGGDETRPKNVSVIYAIAMYSGAGSSYNYDSDLRARQQEMDSDLRIITHEQRSTDSDLRIEIHTRNAADSDLDVRVVDNDSDILVLQEKVATLSAGFSLVQFSTAYPVTATLSPGTDYVITNEVINTADPEDFCYPDIEFFYETQGSNVNAFKSGRKLDGNANTPRISYRVIHQPNGDLIVGMSTDSDIVEDIRIVSTFRTQ